MAEIAVLLVLKKIAIALAGETLSFAKPLLAKKSELVAALPDDMKLISNELELIRAFLKEIGRKGWKGEVVLKINQNMVKRGLVSKTST